MRAVFIREPGGLDVLEMRQVPEPEPGPGEIRVAVRATALNRADLLQRRGLYPAPPDAPAGIPGLEFVGQVEQAGPRAGRFRPGDRVMGICGGGAYAEKLIIHERAVVPVPSRLSDTDAAAVPEAFFTGFDALLLQAGVCPGENVLVHAVGSGVGTAAVQIASVAGARTLGTARSPAKLERAKALGLDVGILVEGELFANSVRRATGGRGADIVIDLVGGAYLAENVEALAPGGRQIVLGLVGGLAAELALGLLLNKRLTLRGSVLRSRPIEEKIAVAQAFERQMLPHLETGRLRPVVDVVMPMGEVREAHARMESNANFGKIVLAW